jgi:excisionase family DNA binding protein
MVRDVAHEGRQNGAATVTYDHLMNVSEVAEFLGLSKGTIYHLVSQQRVPCIRLSNRCVRFRRSDLEAWIATKKSSKP